MPSIHNNHNIPMHIAEKVFFFALLCAGAQSAFGAQSKTIGLLKSPAVSATTEYVVAQNLSYAAPCAATSVYTGLFVRNGGQWEDHNRCFSRTSANKDPAWRNSAVCLFKYPLAVNKPRNEILFRVYDVDSSCRYLGTYKDYAPVSNVIRDNAYDEVRSSTVKLENATSRSIVDRNGGTTYEYYSLRGADVALRAGTFENALHANFGAAMQTVLFGEKLTLTPCGIQGVWNPTQAGATCGTNRAGHIFVKPGTEGLNVICDGCSTRIARARRPF